MTRNRLRSLLTALVLAASLAPAAEWVSISDGITNGFPQPGSYGPTAGVVVDRASGHVFMVVSDYGIWRSTDAGATWVLVSTNTPPAGTPTVFKGIAYWTTGKSILTSKDKGATWTDLGLPVDAMFGPMFGKDASHLIVVGKVGFQESKDGGKTWQVVAPLPPGFTVNRVGPNYAWDHHIFYASSMSKHTFKFER
jgi:photosystem II stability/assembly factor-like uncharacterized protein